MTDFKVGDKVQFKNSTRAVSSEEILTVTSVEYYEDGAIVLGISSDDGNYSSFWFSQYLKKVSKRTGLGLFLEKVK